MPTVKSSRQMNNRAPDGGQAKQATSSEANHGRRAAPKEPTVKIEPVDHVAVASGAAALLSLPNEVTAMVLNYLNPVYHARVAQTCRHLATQVATPASPETQAYRRDYAQLPRWFRAAVRSSSIILPAAEDLGFIGCGRASTQRDSAASATMSAFLKNVGHCYFLFSPFAVCRQSRYLNNESRTSKNDQCAKFFKQFGLLLHPTHAAPYLSLLFEEAGRRYTRGWPGIEGGMTGMVAAVKRAAQHSARNITHIGLDSMWVSYCRILGLQTSVDEETLRPVASALLRGRLIMHADQTASKLSGYAGRTNGFSYDFNLAAMAYEQEQEEVSRQEDKLGITKKLGLVTCLFLAWGELLNDQEGGLDSAFQYFISPDESELIAAPALKRIEKLYREKIHEDAIANFIDFHLTAAVRPNSVEEMTRVAETYEENTGLWLSPQAGPFRFGQMSHELHGRQDALRDDHAAWHVSLACLFTARLGATKEFLIKAAVDRLLEWADVNGVTHRLNRGFVASRLEPIVFALDATAHQRGMHIRLADHIIEAYPTHRINKFREFRYPVPMQRLGWWTEENISTASEVMNHITQQEWNFGLTAHHGYAGF